MKACSAIRLRHRGLPTAQPQPNAILVTEGTEGTQRSPNKAKNFPALWPLCLLRELCDKSSYLRKQRFERSYCGGEGREHRASLGSLPEAETAVTGRVSRLEGARSSKTNHQRPLAFISGFKVSRHQCS